MHTRHGVEPDGCVQFIHRLEERNELFSVKRFISYYPGNDNAEQTELLDGAAGFFDEHAVIIAQCAKALADYGVEARHLRAFRSAADRQSDLIAQIAGPVVKAGKAGARDRADDLAREVAALAITLHTSLIKSAVRDVLDR